MQFFVHCKDSHDLITLLPFVGQMKAKRLRRTVTSKEEARAPELAKPKLDPFQEMLERRRKVEWSSSSSWISVVYVMIVQHSR